MTEEQIEQGEERMIDKDYAIELEVRGSSRGGGENQENQDWLKWLAAVMQNRPKGNAYLDSERGLAIGSLCINLNREMFSWRRSDVDTFWPDVQLYTKYKLTDEQISFIEKMQAGIDQHKEHSEERKAYAEMIRGMTKLKELMKEE